MQTKRIRREEVIYSRPHSNSVAKGKMNLNFLTTSPVFLTLHHELCHQRGQQKLFILIPLIMMQEHLTTCILILPLESKNCFCSQLRKRNQDIGKSWSYNHKYIKKNVYTLICGAYVPTSNALLSFYSTPKSAYSIRINTPSLTNPYFGTGPRSEVSSESHKCPYQSITLSNSL